MFNLFSCLMLVELDLIPQSVTRTAVIEWNFVFVSFLSLFPGVYWSIKFIEDDNKKVGFLLTSDKN